MRASSARLLTVMLVVSTVVMSVTAASATVASGRSKKPLPQVSAAEARKVLKRYVARDADAALTNDKAALAEFATGLGFDITSAMFDQAAAAGDPAFGEYTSELDAVYTVRSTDYPRRFLALVEDDAGGGSIDRSVRVFVQEAKGGDWKFERALVDPDRGWPEFAVDKDGYVRTDVEPSKLFFDPETAPAELAAYLSVGLPESPAPNDHLFAPSPGTDLYRSDTAKYLEAGAADGYSASATVTPSPHDVLVFRLQDGSALVSFGLGTLVTISHPDANPNPAVSQDEARSSVDARVPPGAYRAVVSQELADFTVVMPTKKSGNAATASNVYFGPVSISATPVADPSLYR